jgi:hypothetical protein
MDGDDQAPSPTVDPVRIEVVEQGGHLQFLPFARLSASAGRCQYELVVRSRSAGSTSEARQSGTVPPEAAGPLGQSSVAVPPGGTASADLKVYCGEPPVLRYEAERELSR